LGNVGEYILLRQLTVNNSHYRLKLVSRGVFQITNKITQTLNSTIRLTLYNIPGGKTYNHTLRNPITNNDYRILFDIDINTVLDHTNGKIYVSGTITQSSQNMSDTLVITDVYSKDVNGTGYLSACSIFARVEPGPGLTYPTCRLETFELLK
jgi:hypothetical protein